MRKLGSVRHALDPREAFLIYEELDQLNSSARFVLRTVLHGCYNQSLPFIFPEEQFLFCYILIMSYHSRNIKEEIGAGSS